MTPLRLLIDTDTASDDAVALLLAARSQHAEIEAVTVVAGNVPLPLAVANALITLEICGATDVPVHAGCAQPLLRPLETAEDVHGPDGMGGAGLPTAARPAEAEHAVDALIRTTKERPGELTLVTLGPLTNVATALSRDPGLADRLAGVYIMGGAADCVGNVSASAEFNVWVDPEAAEIVLRSGAPITMVGWDVSRRHAVMRRSDQEQLEAIGTDLSRFVNRINRTLADFCASITQLEGYDLPDPITMAIALDPTLVVHSERLGVTVDTSGTRARGTTFVDHLGIEGLPVNATVVREADEHGFKQMLYRACADEGVHVSEHEQGAER